MTNPRKRVPLILAAGKSDTTDTACLVIEV